MSSQTSNDLTRIWERVFLQKEGPLCAEIDIRNKRRAFHFIKFLHNYKASETIFSDFSNLSRDVDKNLGDCEPKVLRLVNQVIGQVRIFEFVFQILIWKSLKMSHYLLFQNQMVKENSLESLCTFLINKKQKIWPERFVFLCYHFLVLLIDKFR